MDERASPPLIYNHFEVLRGLATKTGLVDSLKKFYADKPIDVFEATPTSFNIHGSMCTQEWKDFRKRIGEIAKGYCKDEKVPYKHCVKNLWLVKPDNLN
jgi:hypothetical protein